MASIKFHRTGMVCCFAKTSKHGDYLATLNRKIYLTGQPQMMLSVISRDWCLAIMDKGNIIALNAPPTLIGDLGKGIVRACFSEPIPAPLAEALATLGEVSLLDPSIAHILLGAASADKIITCVRSSAVTANVSIKSLSILEPNLEAVFLHLTGGPPAASLQYQ